MQQAIITAARGWLGTPYQHQASVKHVGADCLGLIRGVWREIYGQEPCIMPNYTPDWAEAQGVETLMLAAQSLLTPIALEDIEPSDLLLFRWKEDNPAKHCGILTAPNSFIHAHDGAFVTEVAFASWWQRRIAYAFRFAPA